MGPGGGDRLLARRLKALARVGLCPGAPARGLGGGARQDGVPIRGPYGLDGRLVNASELDECNGRTTVDATGREEYHYVWSVRDPFLPRCFKLPPATLKLKKSKGDACREHGERPASFKEQAERCQSVG